jgi:hypothetical protein
MNKEWKEIAKEGRMTVKSERGGRRSQLSKCTITAITAFSVF